MDNKIRAYIYAFLSRVFSNHIDQKLLKDLQSNEELLKTIGENGYDYLLQHDSQTLLEELNIEYYTLFVMNNHPIESSVQDVKHEILVGLQNPVMQFYFEYGYDLNLEASHLHVPDHIGMEFGFMQNLILQNDKQGQHKFYEAHLLTWVPPFLISIKEMTKNPFYSDLCDFTIDFLLEDYSNLTIEVQNGI